MVAALPHLDALVSGHSFQALREVTAAIAADPADLESPARRWAAPRPAGSEEPESWPSATPVPGSSVAMPSGYGPKRGHTTPGWSSDEDEQS
jgi:uncharacterized protein